MVKRITRKVMNDMRTIHVDAENSEKFYAIFNKFDEIPQTKNNLTDKIGDLITSTGCFDNDCHHTFFNVGCKINNLISFNSWSKCCY